jgi:EAL domain-containing protein (putative c-di-GMP-specific phosphodiesterase class I)
MLLPITVSIGIAIAPEHGSRPWELLAHADTAMYQAKRLHTGVEVFDPGKGNNGRTHLEFQAAFHAALEREELVVYYQPKIDLTDDRVVGVEALVRWNRPGWGLVTPDGFLHLVQETGMMSGITSFVLRQAARDCSMWRRLGHDVSVSVNVPASNLVDAGLPDTVFSLIEREGLAPESLIVEITENSLMLDQVRSVEVLERLRAAGVRVSIDDYGTGFTSLGHLHHLPIDELKLDRSFVTDLLESQSHEAIVFSTIKLGHALGFEVVAEGIESAAVLDHLREMGCDLGQGYHILRPAPAHALLAYLEEKKVALHGPRLVLTSSGTRGCYGDARLRVVRGLG